MELFGKLGINASLLIFQIINFLVLLWVLKKILYKPVMAVLEARRDRIIENEKTAERLKEETEQAKVKIEEELTEARKDARDIVARAQEQAEQTHQQAHEDATAEAQGIVDRAKRSIAAEKAQLLDSVRDDVVGLVVGATEKVLKRELGEGHQSFIADQLKKKDV